MKCYGQMSCQWYATPSQDYPCGENFTGCVATTATPTAHPVATSHGDPIIWTFNDECYDLNKDGLYLASKHAKYGHEVKIAVYNNFMREVQVVESETGRVMLAIDTTGKVLRDGFQYFFDFGKLPCGEGMKKTECDGEYTFWEFDAQNFRYRVHLLRHDYLDDGIPEGELG